jgi:hypothetical protein
VPDDPLRHIEDTLGQQDIGRMAVNIYRGALEQADGDTEVAFVATAAYFAGLSKSAPPPETDTR